MPVLVTHPETTVGRAVARALLDDDAQVRAFGPAALPELRAAGGFVAVGAHDDHGVLEAALAQVHTLLHLGTGLLADTPDRWLVEGVGAVDAAVRAGVQRLVLLSLPGASPTAGDPARRAAGVLEEHAAAAAVPTVAVRVTLVDTPALRDAVAALGGGVEDAVVAPVRPADLVAALVEIDRARSSATTGHAVLAATGPEPLTVADWLRRVGVRDADGATSFVGRTYRPGGTTSPLRAALPGPWLDRAPGVADLWSFTGVVPQPLVAGTQDAT